MKKSINHTNYTLIEHIFEISDESFAFSLTKYSTNWWTIECTEDFCFARYHNMKLFIEKLMKMLFTVSKCIIEFLTRTGGTRAIWGWRSISRWSMGCLLYQTYLVPAAFFSQHVHFHNKSLIHLTINILWQVCFMRGQQKKQTLFFIFKDILFCVLQLCLYFHRSNELFHVVEMLWSYAM